MSRWVSIALVLMFSIRGIAESPSKGGGSDSGGGYVAQTQKKRSTERFNIIDWLTDQKKIRAAQDAKFGGGGSGKFWFPDLVAAGRSSSFGISRDGTKLGSAKEISAHLQIFFNNLISVGDKTRSLNVDIGFEGFNNKSSDFLVDPLGTQADWLYSETGGALLFRPFGRSSQDTGLTVKVGYMDLKEKGLWQNATNEVNLFGTYLGADTKLYLLPFLGAQAQYSTVLETNIDSTGSKWSMQKFKYGAFLEIYVLGFEAFAFWTEYKLSPAGGGSLVLDRSSGVGFSGILYF